MTLRCPLLPSRMTSQPHANSSVVDAVSGQSARRADNRHSEGAPACTMLRPADHPWRTTNAGSLWQVQLSPCLRPCSVHQHGGVAHDHEPHPKQPTDQDSVEALARQRDCITQAAADSEIVLLSHCEFGSILHSSTSSREEALRLDDEDDHEFPAVFETVT